VFPLSHFLWVSGLTAISYCPMTVWWFAWGVFPSQHPFYFSCFPLLVQSSLTTSRSPISSAEWPLTCSQTLSINFHICHAHLWLHHRFPFIYYYWFALTNYGWDYWQDLAIASVQVSFVAGSLIIAIFFDVQAATPPLKIFSPQKLRLYPSIVYDFRWSSSSLYALNSFDCQDTTR
jgi:hypothetical protein